MHNDTLILLYLHKYHLIEELCICILSLLHWLYASSFTCRCTVSYLPDVYLTPSWVLVFRFWRSAVGKDRANVNSWERKYSAADEMPCATYSGTGLRVERAACSIAVDPRVKGVLQTWYQSSLLIWNSNPNSDTITEMVSEPRLSQNLD